VLPSERRLSPEDFRLNLLESFDKLTNHPIHHNVWDIYVLVSTIFLANTSALSQTSLRRFAENTPVAEPCRKKPPLCSLFRDSARTGLIVVNTLQPHMP
jgi:hypothetical protein